MVGNAHDDVLRSGVTVLTADAPFTAAVHVMGGAPGTRETDALAPGRLVGQADAIVLAGGSAFGLDAASGVADALARAGRGFAVGDVRVPIVPAAIVFDLMNGGTKTWDVNPYRDLGARALAAAATGFAIGSQGAGFGATTADLRGGLGTASAVSATGHTVAALVVVNAVGSAVSRGGPHFLAAPWEQGGEFGGLGPDPAPDPDALVTKLPAPREATTIAIVATDARLDHAQTERMAVAAHDGMARALSPAHTPFDGDLVFGVSAGDRPLDGPADLLAVCHAGATALARAIARGVHAASADPAFPLPAWAAKHG